jgi:hypothetical protein
VDPASTARTLGHPLAVGDGPVRADLDGYRRAWNTATGTHSHPDRRFVLPDGVPYEGLVAVLGVLPEPGARCSGAVLRITAGDLARLTARERNYECVDVTGQVRRAGRPVDGVVLTFVPRPASVELLRDGGRCVVRRDYAVGVERAFDRLGPGCLADYRATTTPGEYPVLDLAVCWT